MTESTFAGIANILSAMPAHQPWDDRTSTVYAMVMKDWDDVLAQKATMKALMTRKWRPTPSELREIALQMKRIHVPNQTMHEQVRHVVIFHPPSERKEAAERLIKQGKISPLVPDLVERMGGWKSAGLMTEDELSRKIEQETEKCLESGAVDHMLSTPMPMLEGVTETKMIGQ
jgi:hypothetical protein